MEVLTAPLTEQEQQLQTNNEEASTVPEDAILDLKYQRRSRGDYTTAVIDAPRNHPILPRLKQLVDETEASLDEIDDLYMKALHEDLTDENGWYRGIRKITGGRFEIKVLGDFFVRKFGDLPQDMVDYAEEQAFRDERVQAMKKGGQLAFSDWSIIVSRQCQEQTIHTDVPVDNVQFGLILRGKREIPGTRVIIREDFGPHTVEDLISGIWQDAPDSLKAALMTEGQPYEWTNKILNIFGPMLPRLDVLEANMAGAESFKKSKSCGKCRHDEENPAFSDKSDEEQTANPLPLQCGDLICTSGGVPHAGPACDHFRMVMFGAASPTKAGLYDVDDQFFAHSAILYIIQCIWDLVDSESKVWLMHRLAWVAQDYDVSIADKHEGMSPLLVDFMNVVKFVAEQDTHRVIDQFMEQHGDKQRVEIFPLLSSQR